jgi:hypothetical protein
MCVLWRVLSSFFEYPGYTLFTGYIGAIAPHEGTVRASVGRICLLLVPFSDGELSAHKIPESLMSIDISAGMPASQYFHVEFGRQVFPADCACRLKCYR